MHNLGARNFVHVLNKNPVHRVGALEATQGAVALAALVDSDVVVLSYLLRVALSETVVVLDDDVKDRV